ncbi:secondary thiamine-phosphate synthase enzyme YjbQ [bacterium]|nr:secondary thiamine-phosphate synthase enzyme YjbQ [bacterium]
MKVFHEEHTIPTGGQGLVECTALIHQTVARSGVQNGLCTTCLLHTSASLLVQENADPSARRDLEYFFAKLVPENDPGFTHTAEGPDDMPSHIKAALTQTSLSIPVVQGALVLGTWQGIYLWEHRDAPHRRRVLVHLLGEGS